MLEISNFFFCNLKMKKNAKKTYVLASPVNGLFQTVRSKGRLCRRTPEKQNISAVNGKSEFCWK
jgi:hypothetical protein